MSNALIYKVEQRIKIINSKNNLIIITMSM